MEWRQSKAHRAAFIQLERRVYGELKCERLWDDWDTPLGEPHSVAIQRWIDEGCYRRGSPVETLALTLTVPALKEMLKARGLAVGGKKADLMGRLMTADRQSLEDFAAANPIWFLTDEAQRSQDAFRAEIAHAEATVMQEAQALFEAGDIAGTCAVWQRHEEGRVFSEAKNTIGFSDSADLAASRRAEIERFFAIGPRETAIQLAMETLFGKGPMSTKTRMLNTRAAFERDMDSARAADFVIGVEIRRSPAGECDACADIVGCWPKDKVPAVPNPRCHNEDGCLCMWLSIFEGEPPSSPWRA